MLHISLPAPLELAPAFVFGKLRLVELYLSQNRTEEGRRIVKELEKMGLVEHDKV